MARTDLRRGISHSAAAVVSASLLLALTATAGASGPTWTTTTLPWAVAGPSNPSAADVACTTATSCVAVVNTAGLPALDVYDGATWAVTPAPLPAGDGGTLLGVSCPTSTGCVAVGADHHGSSTSPLAVTLAGGSWSAAVLPGLPGLRLPRLTSVSCLSPTSCVAVGSAQTQVNGLQFVPGQNDVPIVDVLSGTTWTAARLAAPSGALADQLVGVACPSAGTCVAIGSYVDEDTFYTEAFADVLSVSTWTQSNLPLPVGADEAVPSAVACPSSTHCVAVGTSVDDNGDTQSFSSTWSGTGWASVTLPSPAARIEPGLASLDCVSATSCVAIGTDFRTGYDADTQQHAELLVETLSGTTWTAQTLPSAIGTFQPSIYGVACTASTSCLAVGSFGLEDNSAYQSDEAFLYFDEGTTSHTLVETLAGTTWTSTVLADPVGPPAAGLQSVSCGASTSCVAVGTTETPSGGTTFGERLQGGAWREMALRAPAGESVTLDHVACPTAATCVATGSETARTGQPHLIFARSTDETWSRVRLIPLGRPAVSDVLDLSCTVTRCEALIATEIGGKLGELFATLVGDRWTAVPVRFPKGVKSGGAEALSCAGASCVAIGEAGAASGLVWRGAGRTWSVTRLAAPYKKASFLLDAVSCATAASCDAAAIVTRQGSGGSDATFVWTLRAGAWRPHQVTPFTNSGFATPLALSCSPTQRCALVLETLSVQNLLSGGGAVTYRLLTTGGAGWSQIRLALPSFTDSSTISSVACPSRLGCVAVGADSMDDGAVVPLVTSGP